MNRAADYLRICPVCATAASADAAQCAGCGTLLFGVDLTLRPPAAAPVSAAPVPAPFPASASAPSAPLADRPADLAAARCAHADCGADNVPGRTRCLYCDRPLTPAAPNTPAALPVAVTPAPTFLYRLPAALADKFDIVEVLPAGGAEAEIMLLAGRSSGVKVIAKLYRPGFKPKPDVLERVSRAAFVHVVHLIAWGESDGIGYEVMEYCPQGSLRALMQAGPLRRDQLRDCLDEMAAALAALHALEVIHRDLKPENVLVRRREPLDLVLTDFGIASISDATQLFTSMARSAKYGAPETLSGVLDYAADYWSLGMILVELLTGHHPFDGLSDAVISHRLITTSIDLTEIDAPDWRGLCRALLLRDPQRRWGSAEIRRWLAGDASLIVPEEERPPAPSAAVRPYRIEATRCHTAVELAVALATHWPAGCKDLQRGQLTAWVGQELKDDNLLRFIHDLLEQRDVSDDLRLARLIRHLAPSLPPVWRGASLTVASLLAQAAQAEQGDAAAADWLVSVFAQQVLGELPPARQPAETALAARWADARRRFARCWDATADRRSRWLQAQTHHDGVADFDVLVFGQPAAGTALPPPVRLHPPLLLALADATYAAARHARLRAAAAPWLPHNPWLGDLLDDDDVVAWVVAGFLLPHAQQAAEAWQQRQLREAAAATAQHAALATRTQHALALLRETADRLGPFADEFARGSGAAACQGVLALIEEARAAGAVEDAPLLRTLKRAEPIVLRIQECLDNWAHAARINAVWRNRQFAQGIGYGLLALVLFAESLPQHLILWITLPLAAVVGWRLWHLMELRGAIRKLTKLLPYRVPLSDTTKA